ncbi:ADP-ribosylation factor GTPase-activating protein 2-like isoform X2 [Ylistrum balloti]|uniref:ADP-ribosylation factor GTPase-activating protein 2-like isoform X2 n=1 Tax=Ylistrum balloti TaxID=509963 RepID=UPI002905ACCC|nr:ADP-ribosylation factor GTPase-activating protein 2-like isoform X2 [Ylistrum balloti]XP_060070159.1 ADP-ribosylation factor GTPase-activating protein 2-like isoform X2 [Ylistrum balloti]
MADHPSKSDIQTIFKRLRSIPTNKQCFDCGSNNPTWASVTYGVFLCIDCSATHRSLGVHVTFIRSTQLDTSWTWLQLRAMQVGGNANAVAFFRQHGCTTSDSQQKYHSRAAMMYKEKLTSLANNANRLHGTKLTLDSGDRGNKLHIDSHDTTSPVSKEVDFFDEHTESFDTTPAPAPISDSAKLFSSTAPKPIKNGNLNKEIDPSEGPSVEAALSMSPTQAAAHAEPRKSIIGAKKPAGGRKGKSGMGAQRVKANFNEIESRAQQLDQERETLAANQALVEARTKEEQEKQMASMRLAYKDMSLQRKKEEEKLKVTDPKKAAQYERLGMGFVGNREFSHSAISDMQTIEQSQPNKSSSNSNGADRFDRKPARSKNFFDDELDSMGFSSSSSKYDSPFGEEKDSFSSWGSSNKSGSWDIDRFESKQQSFSETLSSSRDDDRPSRSRKAYDYNTPSKISDEAQKKFAGAKSISSDQFFGNKDMDFSMKQNMSRFEGSSSISSADFYGESSSKRSQNYNNSGPDFQDIKDGVKQGVTKVAGKLSTLANGVMNSLQN